MGQWGPWVAAAFAVIAATVQAISEAWQDRKSTKSQVAVSASVKETRGSFRDLWMDVRVTLQDFKYWIVQGSLHEPLKPPKESGGKVDAKITVKKPHRMFKEVQVSSFHCDKCRKLAGSVKYQCTDCDQGYCTNCWPRKQKRGARLEDTAEQPSNSKHLSIHRGKLDPLHSALSSPEISPTQTPTEDVPLRHIEEGRVALLPNISTSLS